MPRQDLQGTDPRSAAGASANGARGLGRRTAVLALGGLLLLGFSVVEVWRWRAAGPGSLSHEALPLRPLEGRTLDLGDRLAYPVAVAAVGERIVILDAHLEPAVHLIEPDGRVLGLGVAGDGPGEYRAPRSVVAAPEGAGAFWVYDIALRRLTRIDPAAEAATAGDEVPTVTLRTDAVVTDPVWQGAERLLALGYFTEGRFAAFDRDGGMRQAVGALPESDREVPPTVLQHAWQGRMEPRPDGGRLAVGSRHAGRLEIFAADGRLVRRAEVPFEFLPRYRVAGTNGEPRLGTGEDLRFGYLDVSVTGERIFALFSGRLRGAFAERAPFGDHVHVFDWEGRFLEALRLDADALAIAVDPDGGTLYAVGHHPAPAARRYALEQE